MSKEKSLRPLVEKALADGEPQSSIARRLGISRQRVNQLARPREHAARARLREAVARGAVSSVQACQRCGSSAKTEAHHPDYAKPLAVEFLCRKCHRSADHEKRGSAARAQLAAHPARKVALDDFLAVRSCPACQGVGEEAYFDGAAFRAAREEQGVSLRELAAEIPCSPSYLSDVELGRRRFSEDFARQYLDALKIL
jgi:transcriptional regulator with XRE-family HTH domain